MPFLRQEPDNTLGETLGNLGSALGSALNPMNQVRAQDIMAQIQQRRWEVMQQQRIDAANQNAAAVFRTANPLGMDPASLEVAATGISRGQYDPSTWVSSTTGLAKQRAAQAASDAVSSDPDVQGYTPAERASVQSLVLNGTSLADAKTQVANERLTAAKSSRGITAGDAAASAASKPGMPDELGPLAASAALTSPTDAEKLIAGGRARVASTELPTTTSRFSPEVSGLTADQAAAGQTPVLPAQLEPQKISGDIAADVAKRSMGPGAADQPIRGGTFDPTTNTFVPAAPAPPNAPPVVPTPGPSGTVTVAPAPPDTAAVASTEGSKTTAHEIAAGDVKVLDSAVSESGAAQSMKAKLSQLKDLSDSLDTGGLGLTSRVLRTLADYNIHPGDVGATYAAIQQLINSEIPDVRQKAGIQRLAGPAIKEEQLILGTANMPKSVLNNIIANEEASADLQISRAQLAYQARNGGMPMGEYYQKSLALDATIKQHTDELRNLYKAVGTLHTRPADAPPVVNNTLPVAPDGSQPIEMWDVKNGKLVPMR